jgi:hypothetical protein
MPSHSNMEIHLNMYSVTLDNANYRSLINDKLGPNSAENVFTPTKPMKIVVFIMIRLLFALENCFCPLWEALNTL